MKLVPFVVIYNGAATGPCIKRCSNYLMADAPPFGSAIECVELYARCQTREPMMDNGKFLWDRFQAGLATLPSLQFYRKKRLFVISFVSQWVHSDAMFGARVIDLPPAEFDCLCREFAAALGLIRRRVKKSDVFDMDRLEDHLQGRLKSFVAIGSAQRVALETSGKPRS